MPFVFHMPLTNGLEKKTGFERSSPYCLQKIHFFGAAVPPARFFQLGSPPLLGIGLPRLQFFFVFTISSVPFDPIPRTAGNQQAISCELISLDFHHRRVLRRPRFRCGSIIITVICHRSSGEQLRNPSHEGKPRLWGPRLGSVAHRLYRQ